MRSNRESAPAVTIDRDSGALAVTCRVDSAAVAARRTTGFEGTADKVCAGVAAAGADAVFLAGFLADLERTGAVPGEARGVGGACGNGDGECEEGEMHFR